MLACCQRWLGRVRRHPFRAAALVVLLGVGGALAARPLRAYSHYRSAVRCLSDHDFEPALAHLDACLEVWPGSASAHLLAARAARRLGQPARADEHLEACLREGGPAEQVVLERYLLRAQAGNFAEVEKKLLAFVHRGHPDTPVVLDVLTERWMLEHRLAEAEAHLDLWLSLEPDSRPATVRRAWVDERLFRTGDAIDRYRRALELAPERDRRENDRVRLRLGELLLQAGRAAEAREHFELLRGWQPENEAVVLGLARCRRELGRPDEAAALLDGLIAAGRSSGQVLGERGRLALQAGETARAESWLRQAAALCPFDREIASNLRFCLQKAGRPDEARAWQTRLAEIQRDERQMAQLMKEVLRSPEDADLRHRIGTIFLRNRMDEDGRRWLLSALAQDPGHVAAHRALAEHFEGLGQPDRALPHRRALQQLGTQDRDSTRGGKDR